MATGERRRLPGGRSASSVSWLRSCPAGPFSRRGVGLLSLTIKQQQRNEISSSEAAVEEVTKESHSVLHQSVRGADERKYDSARERHILRYNWTTLMGYYVQGEEI